jgi:hypothetical protein
MLIYNNFSLTKSMKIIGIALIVFGVLKVATSFAALTAHCRHIEKLASNLAAGVGRRIRTLTCAKGHSKKE